MPQDGITMWTGSLHIFPLPLVGSTDRERDGKDRERVDQERGRWKDDPPLCTTLICFFNESACPSTALQCGQGAFTYFLCPS